MLVENPRWEAKENIFQTIVCDSCYNENKYDNDEIEAGYCCSVCGLKTQCNSKEIDKKLETFVNAFKLYQRVWR